VPGSPASVSDITALCAKELVPARVGLGSQTNWRQSAAASAGPQAPLACACALLRPAPVPDQDPRRPPTSAFLRPELRPALQRARKQQAVLGGWVDAKLQDKVFMPDPHHRRELVIAVVPWRLLRRRCLEPPHDPLCKALKGLRGQVRGGHDLPAGMAPAASHGEKPCFP
jgi:hypothetical protein